MYCSIPLTIRRGLQFSLKAALGLLPAVLLLLNSACHQSAHPVGQAPARSSPTPAQNSAAANRNGAASVNAGIGFTTRQKFLDHFDKHGAEFGSVSREEYLRQAQQLRDRPAGRDVLEVTRADGVVTRFDRQSGAFLAFNSDLTIRTFFKPNDGENYFRRQSKRSAGKPQKE